jgi:hypothetical protein
MVHSQKLAATTSRMIQALVCGVTLEKLAQVDENEATNWEQRVSTKQLNWVWIRKQTQ